MGDSMRLSSHCVWLVSCITLVVATFAACDEPAASKRAAGFAIVRDPALGKPFIAWRTPPQDAQGRQAVDVLERFLKHVRDGELDNAKQHCRFSVWTSKARGTIGDVTKKNLPTDPEYAQQAHAKLAASEALFPKFVEELCQAKQYTLGATVKQKSPYWTIRVVADEVNKQPWPNDVYLGFEDNRWEIDIPNLVHRYQP